jgi:hypothetical protein
MAELQEKAQVADEANERVLEMLTKLHAVGCIPHYCPTTKPGIVAGFFKMAESAPRRN